MSNSLHFWQILDPILGSESKLTIYRDSQTNDVTSLKTISMLCEYHQSNMGNCEDYLGCPGKGKLT